MCPLSRLSDRTESIRNDETVTRISSASVQEVQDVLWFILCLSFCTFICWNTVELEKRVEEGVCSRAFCFFLGEFVSFLRFRLHKVSSLASVTIPECGDRWWVIFGDTDRGSCLNFVLSSSRVLRRLHHSVIVGLHCPSALLKLWQLRALHQHFSGNPLPRTLLPLSHKSAETQGVSLRCCR